MTPIPDSVPLSSLLKSSGAAQLALFQRLFPSMTSDALETVSSFRLSLGLVRKNSALVKHVSWQPDPQTRAQGFSASAQKQLVDEVGRLVGRLGPGWTADTLAISGKDIKHSWASGVRMANHALYVQAANEDAKVLQAPPAMARAQSEGGFTVQVRAQIVNPDDTTQVWQSGPATPIPADYASWPTDRRQAWWNETLSAVTQGWGQDELGLNDLPRQLRPLVRLGWSVVAPDDTELPAPSVAPWTKNTAAARWTAERKKAMAGAFDAIGAYVASLRLGLDVKPPSAQQWDLVDGRQASDPKSVSRELVEMAKRNPEGARAVFAALKKTFLDHLVVSGLDKMAWHALGPVRAWVSEQPWVAPDMLQDWVDAEQTAVEAAWGATTKRHRVLLSQEPGVRAGLVDVLLWNGLDLADLPESPAPAPVVSADAPPTPSPRPAIDWKPLIERFGVSATSAAEAWVDDLLKDRAIPSSADHPFSRWMTRLNPPTVVRAATDQWLSDNERFNDINRLILHKKDSEEASLNTELVDKLKAVLEVSNSVLEDSAKKGGWWSRVRVGAATNSPEQWADAFMDFQNHMVKMFDAINKQIERDQIWMGYADRLVVHADEVDRRWTTWLADEARALDADRATIEQDAERSADLKVEWNNRLTALESAQSAHQNIKTANSINKVLLEKIRQSTDIKQRLQQRSTMFYWSSLNMFAGIQSLQRNTNSIIEQSDAVQAMADSYRVLTTRSLKDEAEQREKLKEAFKRMSESENGIKDFYQTISAFQQDTVVILTSLQEQRHQMQEQTASVSAPIKMTVALPEPQTTTSTAPGPK